MNLTEHRHARPHGFRRRPVTRDADQRAIPDVISEQNG